MKGCEQMYFFGDTIHDCELDDMELDDFDVWKVEHVTSKYDGKFSQPF